MTPAEITAEVMALSKQEVDRACAEEIVTEHHHAELAEVLKERVWLT